MIDDNVVNYLRIAAGSFAKCGAMCRSITPLIVSRLRLLIGVRACDKIIISDRVRFTSHIHREIRHFSVPTNKQATKERERERRPKQTIN